MIFNIVQDFLLHFVVKLDKTRKKNMSEKLKNGSESTTEEVNNGSFDILTEMSNKFDPDKARQLVESEKSKNTIAPPIKREQEDIPHAIVETKEILEENNAATIQNLQDTVRQSDAKKRHRPTLSSRYDVKERSRVDRIKSDLWQYIGEYERRQSASEPSNAKKAVRLVTDKLGIKTRRGEELRDREAMRIALAEYREEEEERERAIQEREKSNALEREKREAEYEAEKTRRERDSLERDMARARDVLKYGKQERFKGQRIQEIVERDLNARLLTVDDLETEVLSENPEVQKRSISFDGIEVPVYDLKGLSFSVLSTTIDYRKANDGEGGISAIGTETYKTVLNNPEIWKERRDEAEKTDGFGTRNSNARGDTISASYWNSERNIESHVSGDLIYGFERVEPDSIISIFNGDGGTSNMAGRAETSLISPDEIKHLEGAGGTSIYNEVLLRRYSENGMAKRPDYIIAENGKITEVALRHAKYFGIPIINIERVIYAEKAEKKGEELINSISEKDTYLELDGKIVELLSMSRYKHKYHTLSSIGRNFDIPRISPNATAIEKQCLDISKMEQLKRIDFIKTTLEESIDKIEMATKDGKVLSQVFPQFDSFNISIRDVQNQTRSTKYGDTTDSSYSAPGNCNSIEVDFRLKGSSRSVDTRIYDGERILKADEALADGVSTKEDIENADSSFYNTLEPVVHKYFDAYRKNQELVKIKPHL